MNVSVLQRLCKTHASERTSVSFQVYLQLQILKLHVYVIKFYITIKSPHCCTKISTPNFKVLAPILYRYLADKIKMPSYVKGNKLIKIL